MGFRSLAENKDQGREGEWVRADEDDARPWIHFKGGIKQTFDENAITHLLISEAQNDPLPQHSTHSTQHSSYPTSPKLVSFWFFLNLTRSSSFTAQDWNSVTGSLNRPPLQVFELELRAPLSNYGNNLYANVQLCRGGSCGPTLPPLLIIQ